jgi:GNAT superfamily N-acetyltransferase
VTPDVETRPVGPDDLADLTTLFSRRRQTRHCWCMAFCTTRLQFAAGWLGGGNQRRFSAMAAQSAAPMGVLASVAGDPIGWCACGPRSRYTAATDPANPLMRQRSSAEDEAVWLLPCLLVDRGHRGQGITGALVRAAVELARHEGAAALEGWPLAASQGRSGDDFVGREQTFAKAGFSCVDRPTGERAIMRLELGRPQNRVRGTG